MPVILDEAGAADWMNWREPDPLSLKRLLVPAPDDLLVVRPASPLVNSVKNEGPELLEDLSLFGQYAPAKCAIKNWRVKTVSSPAATSAIHKGRKEK